MIFTIEPRGSGVPPAGVWSVTEHALATSGLTTRERTESIFLDSKGSFDSKYSR